jgi:hypothetical protein
MILPRDGINVKFFYKANDSRKGCGNVEIFVTSVPRTETLDGLCCAKDTQTHSDSRQMTSPCSHDPTSDPFAKKHTRQHAFFTCSLVVAADLQATIKRRVSGTFMSRFKIDRNT